MTGWTFAGGVLTFTQDVMSWAGPSLAINPDGSGVATLNGGQPLPFTGLKQVDLNGVGELTVNIVITGQLANPLEMNLNLGADSTCLLQSPGDPAGNLTVNATGETGTTPGSGGESILEAFIGANKSAFNLSTSTEFAAAFVFSSGQNVATTGNVTVKNLP